MPRLSGRWNLGDKGYILLLLIWVGLELAIPPLPNTSLSSFELATNTCKSGQNQCIVDMASLVLSKYVHLLASTPFSFHLPSQSFVCHIISLHQVLVLF